MRWRREEVQVPDPPVRSPKLALTDFLRGDDPLARIRQEHARGGPRATGEDLLIFWAQQWYWGGDDQYLRQMGLWMAEDLRLKGKVRGK